MSSTPGKWRIRSPLEPNEWGLLAAIIVVVVLTTLLDQQHDYWHDPTRSLIDVLRRTSMLGIFALGSAIVIISGGIDLSSGSAIAFCGAVCASVMLVLAPEGMQQVDAPLGLGVMSAGIAAALVAGFLIGSLHAWLITVIGLPPFVATLATLVGLRSLARAIIPHVTEVVLGSPSNQIQVYNVHYRYLSTAPWAWIPIAVFLVLSAAAWILLNHTVVGRRLYALGGNEEAARLSGIRTDGLKWLAYCLSAVLAAVAGVLYIAEQSVADPQTLGRAYELNAIAAAVVGGCSLRGGVGTVLGTMLGCLFLTTVIDSVYKIIPSGGDVYEGLIVGAVVVVAVAFSQLRQAAGRRKLFFPGALGIVAGLTLALFAATVVTIVARPQGAEAAGLIVGLVVLAAVAAVKWLERRCEPRQPQGDFR